MSRWNADFEAQQALQKVQGALDALRQAKLDSITIVGRADYERAIKVLKVLESRFSTIDPELFAQNTWSSFGQWLTNAKDQAVAFSGNLNPGHLTTLNVHLDSILAVLRPLDIKFSENEAKALTEASAIYRQKIVEELDLVKKRAEEVKKQHDLLSGEITTSKNRLDKNDQVIDSQKTRLDNSITEFQKQFSTAQETRNQEFLKAIAQITDSYKAKSDGFDKTFKTVSEKQKVEWDSLVAMTKKHGDDHLEFLNKRKKEVDEIFGAIGQAALAGNFNDTANRERTFADNWRKIAFAFFASMGVIAIVAFALTFKGSPDWETFVFRLGTVLVLSIPAFYAANESSKHREREKLIRKNFLELSAIDAYLVHLPEKDRNDIKGKLSEKFFGVPEIHEKADGVKSKDIMGFVEQIVKDLTKGH